MKKQTKNEVMLLHAGASGINGAKRFKKKKAMNKQATNHPSMLA